MTRLAALAFALLICPLQAQSGPPQCWYYLHNKLDADSVDACMNSARGALEGEGFAAKAGDSSDGYISSMSAENAGTSAQILCYEVNGRRGKVMSFITVAGARACPIADNLFEAMKQP